ncbi:hypothetical protein D3C87_1440430 [compost metagenome]
MAAGFSFNAFDRILRHPPGAVDLHPGGAQGADRVREAIVDQGVAAFGIDAQIVVLGREGDDGGAEFGREATRQLGGGRRARLSGVSQNDQRDEDGQRNDGDAPEGLKQGGRRQDAAYAKQTFDIGHFEGGRDRPDKGRESGLKPDRQSAHGIGAPERPEGRQILQPHQERQPDPVAVAFDGRQVSIGAERSKIGQGDADDRDEPGSDRPAFRLLRHSLTPRPVRRTTDVRRKDTGRGEAVNLKMSGGYVSAMNPGCGLPPISGRA